jgi:membrane protease YdiL (CAAX protease family)
VAIQIDEMALTQTLQRYFGFTVSNAPAPEPRPLAQVIAYSIGIVVAFFLGTVLESELRFTGYGEALAAIPVIVCAVFVLRLPPPAPIRVRWGFRALLLALPFLILPLADLGFPEFSAGQAAVWMVVLIQALGVGVSEELTFRFGLHRLWSHYGAVFYVVASATLFGVLHYPLGLQISVISGIIGVLFATSRAAGMPLVPLIILHAFLDIPEIFRTVSAN